VTRSAATPDDDRVTAYVGLGANLGDARAAIRQALEALAAAAGDGEPVDCSPLYRSAPVEASGPDYLNAVASLRTRLPARRLLELMLGIEQDHGRARPFRNAPRTLDLDLLLYGDQVIDEPGLKVPHPRMHRRAFVLRPLADLAPQLRIPGHGPIGSLLAAVADQRIERAVDTLPG
jgi:2-amino-4-hydroxy-6-hydroxymethyldihydropteridine diphosphokinase